LAGGFFNYNEWWIFRLTNTYSNQQKENMDLVIGDYGLMTPFEISDLTHQESPWIEARGGVPAGVRGSAIISKESMQQYYSGLLA
jgi:uncharacterized phage-associated protein